MSQDLLNYFPENPKCVKTAEQFAEAASVDTDQYQINGVAQQQFCAIDYIEATNALVDAHQITHTIKS